MQSFRLFSFKPHQSRIIFQRRKNSKQLSILTNEMFRLKALRNTSVCEPLCDDVGKIQSQHFDHSRLLSDTVTTAASNSEEFSSSFSSISTSSRSSSSRSSTISSSSASRRSSKSKTDNTPLLSNKMGTKQEKELLKLVRSLPEKARDDLAVQASSSWMKRS